VDIADYKYWTIDDVCRWVRSLGTAYEEYISKFQSHGIDGRTLIEAIDDEGLQEIGIPVKIHRRKILLTLSKLKQDTAAENSDAIESKRTFYDGFDGDFTLPVHRDELSENRYDKVSSCQISTNSELYARISGWIGSLPSGRTIEKIEIVSNAARYRLFLAQMESVEKRQDKPAFQAHLSSESNPEERQRVLDRLSTLCQQVSHNRRARIVRMWHGCRTSTLEDLLRDGFTALGRLDDGWYGKAMYFTSSAKYATHYIEGTDGCLILCYVIILNPFPVIADDALPNVSPNKFRFYGRGNHKRYQCHYALVSPTDGENTADCRPPPSGINDAVYDELAVFQEVNILPQIVVHLK
ncbi:unnamed protein product, partial [Didymodactylos carnosus]